MKSKLLRQILAGALFAAPAIAAANLTPDIPLTDAEIAQTVQHDLLKYSGFTAFDDLSFQVQSGHVTLFGEVTEPFKKTDIEKIAEKTSGANGVTDNVQVLPFSDSDNQLRHRVATLIYDDPSLAHYRAGTNAPIHIIVDNGRITLAGAVNTQADRDDAALLASTAGPTVNTLQVVNPSN